MEVYELLEELENLVASSSRIPLTSRVVLDGETLLDYIDRVRASLPEEFRQSRWVLKERDRILKEAEEEARRVLQDAHKQIERLAEEHEVVKQAKSKAEEVLSRAQEVARDVRSGALEYADQLLARLEEVLEKSLMTVREGRQELRDSQVSQAG